MVDIQLYTVPYRVHSVRPSRCSMHGGGGSSVALAAADGGYTVYWYGT